MPRLPIAIDAQLRANAAMRSPEELTRFEDALAQAVALGDPEVIPDVLAYLDDDAEYLEAMYAIIHLGESFGIPTYLTFLAQALPGLVENAPRWAETVNERILNSDVARRTYADVLRAAPADVQAAAKSLLRDLCVRKPQFIADCGYVLERLPWGPPSLRQLVVVEHPDLARADLAELGFWFGAPSQVPPEVRTDLARLGCVQLRIDVEPYSMWDSPVQDAEPRLRNVAYALATSGALGQATVVCGGHADRPNRVRSYKGVFWDVPALRAGPRLEFELPAGAGETYMIGLAPANDAAFDADRWGTVVLHAPPADEVYWRRLAPDVIGPPGDTGGTPGLVSRVVDPSTTLLLYHPDYQRVLRLNVVYDRTRESAIRWALREVLAELDPAAELPF